MQNSAFLTPRQSREARRLLGWSQYQLAGLSGVPFSAVFVFERIGQADASELQRLRAAFEASGVAFADNEVARASRR